MIYQILSADTNIGDINNAVNIFNIIPENEKNIVIIGAMMTTTNNLNY